MVNNIVDRKCQHVDEVPEKFIKEIYINALRIASAVATEKVVDKYVNKMYSTTGIFRLHPCALAVMKKLQQMFRNFNPFSSRKHFALISIGNVFVCNKI